MEQDFELVRRRPRRRRRRRRKLQLALRVLAAVLLLGVAVGLSAGMIHLVERPVAPLAALAERLPAPKPYVPPSASFEDEASGAASSGASGSGESE